MTDEFLETAESDSIPDEAVRWARLLADTVCCMPLVLTSLFRGIDSKSQATFAVSGPQIWNSVGIRQLSDKLALLKKKLILHLFQQSWYLSVDPIAWSTEYTVLWPAAILGQFTRWYMCRSEEWRSDGVTQTHSFGRCRAWDATVVDTLATYIICPEHLCSQEQPTKLPLKARRGNMSDYIAALTFSSVWLWRFLGDLSAEYRESHSYQPSAVDFFAWAASRGTQGKPSSFFKGFQ